MRKILVVDDDTLNRKILKKILQNEYEVLEAVNGKEALELLYQSFESISAVLLDVIMPVMDGYRVLETMRKDERLLQIPVIVASGSDRLGAEVKTLSLGANDFITKPYDPETILHRLRNTISLRETAAIVNASRVDALTGLFSRTAFFERAAQMIAEHEAGYYTVSCFDINSFKVINDLYGSAKGDDVLRLVAKVLRENFEKIGGICCRISADNFAVLYPRHAMSEQELDNIRRSTVKTDDSILLMTYSVGRYVVDDLSLSVSSMYDRASIAKASIKGRVDVHVAEYDESMRKAILRQQEIVSETDLALEGGQFEVWYQPQYNHTSGALIGAEALVRWRHPRKGLISPAEFIPIFEKNGFIYKLDKYVWELVCSTLRRWLDEGLSPLPLSVNVSRYDVLRSDLVEVLNGLLEKYHLPVDLLRLEITESAFSQSADQIISVVKQLVDCGFTIEIDDFGSGYSSLNTLKDVPADVLKLDMRFLENSENSQRSGNIIESIVRMTKWLGMSVIAEGVETVEQADYLKSIGCNYIQGYLYSKPITVEEYEALSHNVKKERQLLTLETVETLDNSSFWDPRSMDTLIFNSYIGGACILEYHCSEVEILRVNEKYAKALNTTSEKALKISWAELLDDENLAILQDALQRTIKTGEEVLCEFHCDRLPGQSRRAYLRSTVRKIASASNRYLIYCTSENITAQREAEIKVHETAERLQAIMDHIHGGVTATIITDDCPNILFANEQFYNLLGYTEEQFKNEVKNPHELLHPDDRERIVRLTSEASRLRKSFTCSYRVIRRNGTVGVLQSNISITKFANVNEPVQLAVANDITEQEEAEKPPK